MQRTSKEYKEHLRKHIEQACMGTPLQPHAEFAGDYLCAVLIPQIECLEEVEAYLLERKSNET